MAFNLAGTNAASVQKVVGINTVLLSAPTSATPDIVALAATVPVCPAPIAAGVRAL